MTRKRAVALASMILLGACDVTYPQEIIATPKQLSDERVQEIFRKSQEKIHAILRREISLQGLSIALVNCTATPTYRNVKLYKVCT
jgi:hypothetical protein